MINQKGFSLLETIIYLALFTIIIGGGMVSAYQIIESVNASHNHIILQEEANFLFRKIEWALTGATGICTASGSTLAVTKISPASCSVSANILTIDVNGNDMRLARGTSPAVTLNSSSILVSGVTFVKTEGTNGKPDSIASDFTLTTNQNGRLATQDFSLTKYLR